MIRVLEVVVLEQLSRRGCRRAAQRCRPAPRRAVRRYAAPRSATHPAPLPCHTRPSPALGRRPNPHTHQLFGLGMEYPAPPLPACAPLV